MIIDALAHAEEYFHCHRYFAQAFMFLRDPKTAELADGSYELEGRELYAIVSHGSGKTREQIRFEAHRRYMDIQCIMQGTEEMAWLPRCGEHEVSEPYDQERDVEFFHARPHQWIQLHDRQFVVFLPSDIHGPGVTAGGVHKIVIKVKM